MSIRFPEPVANAGLGGDIVRLVRNLLNLLPQLPNVDAQILHIRRLPYLF